MGATQVENAARMVAVADHDSNIQVHAKTIIVVAAINFIYFGQLVAIVGSGLLAQPITQLLGGTTQTVWLSSVLNILTVALSPSVSQAADYWGRKWPLIISTTLGFAGALVVSRAQNVGTVIAGFTVMGCCFGSQPLLHAVVSEVLPRKHRPFAQASVNITAGVGAVIGLMMGGQLVRHGHLENYRVYWYVEAGIFAASAIACALFYNPPPRELQTSLTTGEKLKRLDWIGYFLFTPGLILFCIALSWSQNPYEWTNAHILAPFIIGIVLMIVFSVYEWRFKRDGMLHHGLFKDRNFPIALFVIFAEGIVFFTANAYFAFEVGLFTHADSLVSALHFAIVFLAAMVGAFVAGLYSTRAKAIRSPIVVGFTLIMIFNILMATSTPSSPTNVFWGYPVIAGMGLGALLPIVMVVAQLSTPPELISLTSGLVIAVRALGGTVGLAVNNAILHDALSANIPSKIAAAALPLGLPPSSLGMLIGALASNDQELLSHVPGITPQIIGASVAALTEAYSIGFRNAWIAATCFSFVAVIASCFLFDPQSEFTGHIDAPAEKALIEAQAREEAVHAERRPSASPSGDKQEA